MWESIDETDNKTLLNSICSFLCLLLPGQNDVPVFTSNLEISQEFNLKILEPKGKYYHIKIHVSHITRASGISIHAWYHQISSLAISHSQH